MFYSPKSLCIFCLTFGPKIQCSHYPLLSLPIYHTTLYCKYVWNTIEENVMLKIKNKPIIVVIVIVVFSFGTKGIEMYILFWVLYHAL